MAYLHLNKDHKLVRYGSYMSDVRSPNHTVFVHGAHVHQMLTNYGLTQLAGYLKLASDNFFPVQPK